MNSYINFKEKKIFFNSAGSGEAVILIHGFLENSKIWKKSKQNLIETNKVITLDLPGHGESEVISEIHTMELFADVVKALLDELRIKTAHIIGHSMGGYVCLAFAKKYTSNCKSITLFHSHAAADTPEAKINRARAAKVVSENKKGFIANFIPDLFTQENRIKYKSEITELKEEAKKTPKKGVTAALLGMREREDLQKFISTVELPILFVIGKKDSRADMEMMKNQVFSAKESYALILEETAHMGYIEDFSTIIKQIKAFVNF